MDILLNLPASDKHLLMHFEFAFVLIRGILFPSSHFTASNLTMVRFLQRHVQFHVLGRPFRSMCFQWEGSWTITTLPSQEWRWPAQVSIEAAR